MTAWLLAAALALPPLMPIDAIESGQRGSCLTVFEGTTIEPFEFVVKGVMKDFLGPGKDLVLVRLVGEKPEFTGVVAGMSGSPCSIDGKLVGALAYAFATFAKEPIAGITPMDDMLEVMRQPDEPRPWRIDASPATSSDSETSGRPADRARSQHTSAGSMSRAWVADAGAVPVGGDPAISDQAWEALRAGKAPGAPRAAGLAGEVRPIAAPLSLGGVHPKVLEHFTPWLESEGFLPVAGGLAAGGAAAGAATALAPGAAVAAVLVTGDVHIAATGTVTSVEGNEVLAFGHPFLGTGSLSVPMAAASIVNTMASSLRSFKMSQTGTVLGEVTQDRLTAIGGYLGRVPAMIPVRGSIETAAGKQTFQFQVARDHSLSPRFTAMGIANALYGTVPASGRGTLRLEGTVAARGLEPVTVRSVYASERDPDMYVYAAIDMARTLATLWDTPFGPPPELSIEVNAVHEPEPVVEWIEAVHVDRGTVRPGEAVELSVRIRREDGPVRFERFHLPVPRSWAGQAVELVACSGQMAQRIADAVAGDPRPTNLREIGAWLSSRRLDGHLYLIATREGAGMRAEVDARPFLPPSLVALLSGDATKQRTARGLAWEERRPQPGALHGGVRTQITVLPY